MTDTLVEGAPLNVENIWDELKSKLSQDVIAKIEARHVDKLNGDDYEVRFLGTRVSLDKLAEIISENVNGLQVVGNLACALSIQLSHVNEKIYVSYLAFTPASAKIIDKLIKFDQKEYLSND